MFNNLKTELNKNGISAKEYAKILGTSEKNVEDKLSGKEEFIYSEIIKTCTLLKNYSIDYLFA